MFDKITSLTLNVVLFQIIKAGSLFLYLFNLYSPFKFSSYQFWLLSTFFILYDFFPFFSIVGNFLFSFCRYKIIYAIFSIIIGLASFFYTQLLFDVFDDLIHVMGISIVLICLGFFSHFPLKNAIKQLPEYKIILFCINHLTFFSTYVIVFIISYDIYSSIGYDNIDSQYFKNINSFVVFGIIMVAVIVSNIFICLSSDDEVPEKFGMSTIKFNLNNEEWLYLLKFSVIYYISSINGFRITKRSSFRKYSSKEFFVFNAITCIVMAAFNNKINVKIVQVITFSVGIVLEIINSIINIENGMFYIGFLGESVIMTISSILVFISLSRKLGVETYNKITFLIPVIAMIIFILAMLPFIGNCLVYAYTPIGMIVFYGIAIGLAFVLDNEDKNIENIEPSKLIDNYYKLIYLI